MCVSGLCRFKEEWGTRRSPAATPLFPPGGSVSPLVLYSFINGSWIYSDWCHEGKTKHNQSKDFSSGQYTTVAFTVESSDSNDIGLPLVIMWSQTLLRHFQVDEESNEELESMIPQSSTPQLRRCGYCFLQVNVIIKSTQCSACSVWLPSALVN